MNCTCRCGPCKARHRLNPVLSNVKVGRFFSYICIIRGLPTCNNQNVSIFCPFETSPLLKRLQMQRCPYLQWTKSLIYILINPEPGSRPQQALGTVDKHYDSPCSGKLEVYREKMFEGQKVQRKREVFCLQSNNRLLEAPKLEITCPGSHSSPSFIGKNPYLSCFLSSTQRNELWVTYKEFCHVVLPPMDLVHCCIILLSCQYNHNEVSRITQV